MTETIHSSRLLADGKPCPYCRTPMNYKPNKKEPPGQFTATRDHVIPRHIGGNLVIVTCLRCNNDKGGETPDEWLARLMITGDPRYRHVRKVFERLEVLTVLPVE
jgi:5-methylcytosine-specific restriction endonuclease McrA